MIFQWIISAEINIQRLKFNLISSIDGATLTTLNKKETVILKQHFIIEAACQLLAIYNTEQL